MKRFIFLFVVILLFANCQNKKPAFVKVSGKNFMIDGKPYYFMGTNFWYGAILGSKGKDGNRERLIKELDLMKSIGISNVRVLLGADGAVDQPFLVTPTLQTAAGKYNDDLLDGLDFLLSEMSKRQMVAVIFLNNSWEWSGGYGQYLNWNGYGNIPNPHVEPNTWNDFQKFVSQYYNCNKCLEQFKNHIKFIVERKNNYTGKNYADDPTIMTWEIGNEPRPFGKENFQSFKNYINEISAYIKSLDKNHLVTTGSEGAIGSEDSYELFEEIHAGKDVDYLTMHIWPKNWSWLDVKDIQGSLQKSIVNTLDYMHKHIEIARKLNKPIVMEEFGLPRDFHGYSLTEKTTCRDKYYKTVFDLVVLHSISNDVLAGNNFWAFSGSGRNVANQIYWKKGDDYLGDPPGEEQGLNSVFDSDSTIDLIKKYASLIQK